MCFELLAYGSYLQLDCGFISEKDRATEESTLYILLNGYIISRYAEMQEILPCSVQQNARLL